MAKNLEKNQFVLKCPACSVGHLLPLEASKNASFTCEKCGNKIYIKNDGTPIVFGNTKAVEKSTSEKQGNDSSDETGPKSVPDPFQGAEQKVEPNSEIETETETEGEYPLADW